MIDFQRTRFQDYINRIRPRWTYANFWYDLRFEYWISPMHKRRLIKSQNFCEWDIVDSIAELTFRQFELFWTEYGCRRFNNAEYLKTIKKEQKNWYDSVIAQEKILKYISDIRKYNKNLLEDTHSEQWQYVRHFFVPCEKESNGENYFTMKTDYLEGYFEVSFSFDKDDRLNIKKVIPSGKNKHNLLLAEQRLNELDDKYLKMIIENRQYMWD